MRLILPASLLGEMERHGESQYPEEGAGLILGHINEEERAAVDILPVGNTFDASERSHRYMIAPEAMIEAEREADGRDLEVIGVFHSHPDHPPRPSQFDQKMALPWFFYLITSVQRGEAMASRVWRLLDDRDHFEEVSLHVKREEETA